MKALVRLSVVLGMAVALNSGAIVPSQAVEHGFIVDPLRFTFPVKGNPAAEISFLIFSKDDQVSDASVKIIEIKDPNGLSLSRDSITLSLESKVVTPEGVRVALRPGEGLFTHAGDYSVIFLIAGRANNRTVKTRVTLTINHPATEIDLDQLQDHTIELERSWPGGEASGNYMLYLPETSGTTSLRKLQMDVQVEPIFVQDTKLLVPGSLKATPQFIRADNTSANENRGQWALVINVSGIKRTGDLTSELRISSPGFDGSKAIPLRISVTDRWGFPLSVIFFGVLGGFLTNYVSQNWKPRQQNRYKILQLRAMAKRYESLVLEAEKVTKIQTVLDELNNAEEENNLGNAAKAETGLEKAGTDLKSFRQEEIKQQIALQDQLRHAKAQVEQYSKTLPNRTHQEDEKLRTLLAELNSGRIEVLLEEDKVDEAKRLLNQSQSVFAEFKKQRLNRDLESLKKQIKQLGSVPDPLKAEMGELDKKVQETANLIRAGDIDNARENLNQLEQGIKLLNKKLPSNARSAGEVIARNPLLSKQQENTALDQTRILVMEQSSLRTTESHLHFQVEDAEQLMQSGDVLRWEFTNGGRTIESDPRIVAHAFAKPGSYHVKVDILRGPAKEIIKVLTLPVTIREGPTVIGLEEIRGKIERSEVLISVIAVVLATITGLIYLYIDNAFGSLKNYLLAFLWGFGIDSSVRGFTAALKTATGRGT